MILLEVFLNASVNDSFTVLYWSAAKYIRISTRICFRPAEAFRSFHIFRIFLLIRIYQLSCVVIPKTKGKTRKRNKYGHKSQHDNNSQGKHHKLCDSRPDKSAKVYRKASLNLSPASSLSSRRTHKDVRATKASYPSTTDPSVPDEFTKNCSFDIAA